MLDSVESSDGIGRISAAPKTRRLNFLLSVFHAECTDYAATFVERIRFISSTVVVGLTAKYARPWEGNLRSL